MASVRILVNILFNTLSHEDAGFWWKDTLGVLWSDGIRESIGTWSYLGVWGAVFNEFTASGR